MKLNIDKAMGDARAAFLAGRVEEAETLLNQVLSLQPKEFRALYALGTIAANTGRPDEAIEHFRSVVRLDPKNPQAQFFAGLLLSHRERFAEAIPFLEQALSVQASNLQALAALGQSYLATGQPGKALDSFTKAINMDPANAELYLSRASCYRQLAREGEAEHDLEQALKAGPNAGIFLALSEIQLALGRLDQALANSKQAIALNPSLYGAYKVAAKSLLASDRAEEAASFWNQAEERAPSSDAFLTDQADALISTGRFEEARELLRRSIDINPLRPGPYGLMVFSKKSTVEDLPLLTTMEELALGKETSPLERVNLNYALGKANDDLGRYEAAINFFDLANALMLSLKPQGERFVLSDLQAHVELQNSRYTKSFLQDHRSDGNPSTTPIFVLGMMRSGTTLVEQILSCHPKIGGAGEQSFWSDHEAEVVNKISGKFKFQTLQNLSEEYVKTLTTIAPGFDRIVDKNPANCFLVGLLAAAFPNAKIIHIRRNPVDTALSIWTTPMKTNAPFVNDRANIVAAYKQYDLAARHWRSTLSPRQYLEAEYETLTQDPERTIRGMLEFLQLDWNEACLHPELKDRMVQTPSFWQVRQPLYRTSEGRWKRYEPWLGPFRELLHL